LRADVGTWRRSYKYYAFLWCLAVPWKPKLSRM